MKTVFADLTPAERRVFARLRSPVKIQEYLDSTPYSTDPIYRSPRSVLRDRKAHCFDGALFAAAALRFNGEPPLLVDLRAVHDDDHVLAIFRRHDRYGAIAKSNFVGLRYREPIYRNLRELAMSYFEQYFNARGEKTLRECSVLLPLKRFDSFNWMTSDRFLSRIAGALDRAKHQRLLTRTMVSGLSPVDERSLKAGMLGVNRAGLYSSYQPPPK